MNDDLIQLDLLNNAYTDAASLADALLNGGKTHLTASEIRLCIGALNAYAPILKDRFESTTLQPARRVRTRR